MCTVMHIFVMCNLKQLIMAIVKRDRNGRKKINWLGLVIEIVKAAVAFFAGVQV